uniref:hypothetical protein n=1 Tax=Cyanothece sp. BG0011 TaxID=2082950 RepID=UPI0030DCF6C2
MLKILIELESNAIEEIDSFSKGHITIEVNNKIITSKNKTPSQSMMIFISLVELLDGVRLFIVDKNKKQYNFV